MTPEAGTGSTANSRNATAACGNKSARHAGAREAKTHATQANGTRHTNGRKKGCTEERAAAEGWRRTNGRCGD